MKILRLKNDMVSQVLHEAGTKAGANDGIGLVNAGYRALLMSLRLEKKFVHFGHDLSPTDSVLEAGELY